MLTECPFPDPEDQHSGSPGQERLLSRRFTARDLPGLRVGIEECAARAGLGSQRRGEFVLAVDALITNAVEHAGGGGRVLLRRIGNELECQVSDSGPGFTADVIPELLPGLDGDTRGRGLWLARMLSDRLSISCAGAGAGAEHGARNGGAGGGTAGRGTVVTLAVRLP